LTFGVDVALLLVALIAVDGGVRACSAPQGQRKLMFFLYNYLFSFFFFFLIIIKK